MSSFSTAELGSVDAEASLLRSEDVRTSVGEQK